MQVFYFPIDDENTLEVLYIAISPENYNIELYSYYGTDVSALMEHAPDLKGRINAALEEHILSTQDFMEE